ncbi:hypothetical protein STEG23_034051 [Scotinomys teguina]
MIVPDQTLSESFNKSIYKMNLQISVSKQKLFNMSQSCNPLGLLNPAYSTEVFLEVAVPKDVATELGDIFSELKPEDRNPLSSPSKSIA